MNIYETVKGPQTHNYTTLISGSINNDRHDNLLRKETRDKRGQIQRFKGTGEVPREEGADTH